jgi:tetratricopeptide (TPR) repeat protein
MFEPSKPADNGLIERLAEHGYWPAQAVKHLSEKRYAQAIALCRERLEQQPHLISGRLVYALALYRSGHTEEAKEQFHRVLETDPDNQVALKYLGDIKFADGDEATALADYARILEVDPDCRGLKSDMRTAEHNTIQTITLRREAEPKESSENRTTTFKRRLPFYSETIGDLCLAQGHPRLAAEVYRTVYQRNRSPRLAEKLAQAEQKIRNPNHHKQNR